MSRKFYEIERMLGKFIIGIESWKNKIIEKKLNVMFYEK